MKRYVDEAGSPVVRNILASRAVVTSRLSEVEVASALVRRCREGSLARRDLDRGLAALRADMGSIAVVELTGEVAQTAIALLARHPLRAGDSIQIASCLYLHRHVEDVRLLAYDARLNDAARAEGLRLVAKGP